MFQTPLREPTELTSRHDISYRRQVVKDILLHPSKKILLKSKAARAISTNPAELKAAMEILRKEHDFKTTKHFTGRHPISSAYGLAGFLDGTWSGMGYKKTDNPRLQLEAFCRYLDGHNNGMYHSSAIIALRIHNKTGSY